MVNLQTDFKMSAPLGAPFQLCNHFNGYSVTYIVRDNQTVTEGKNILNALDILPKNATELVYSLKISNAKTNFEENTLA